MFVGEDSICSQRDDQARYFSGEDSCAAQFDALLGDCDALERMKQASFARYQAMFT